MAIRREAKGPGGRDVINTTACVGVGVGACIYIPGRHKSVHDVMNTGAANDHRRMVYQLCICMRALSLQS